MKNRVPYSEVSEHIPLKWQARVKVPEIVTSIKTPKKENKTLYDRLKDGMLQISSVPHQDEETPYKEPWKLPGDRTNESQQNFQEGPAAPIASSCIPGALVVDPFLREIVEENDMKVTDNAMWLLTVALKEHIKNILNDSIEHRKGLGKGEIYPQAIHYPNVLATNSNKNRKIPKGKTSSAPQEVGRKIRINSMDLFAALNMLPSGQVSSIGGSVSRISLEQTFLSAFNSIPSFVAGNEFKDVQSFISNEITAMAKNRKPEEKKTKASHTKSVENQTETSRQPRPTSRQEESAKTPSQNPVPIPDSSQQSSAKASEPNSSPNPIPKSPVLVHNMSPAGVRTPAIGSNQQGAIRISVPEKNVASPQIIDVSQSESEVTEDNSTKQKAASPPIASSIDGSQGIDKKPETSSEVAVVKAENEKPVEKATAVAPLARLKPGAGRGAKNLAALMARAAESSSQQEPTEPEGEKDNAKNATTTENKSNVSNTDKKDESIAATDTTSKIIKSETNQPNAEKPKSEATAQQSLPEDATIQSKQQLQPNAELSKQKTNPPANGEPKPEAISKDSAENTKTEKTEASKEAPSVSPQQPIAPVRRGKGKGFGSKDLAAMRARSMTKTDVGDEKSVD